MTDSQSPTQLTPDLLRAISSLSGVELSPERAEALVSQAAQQIGLMRALDAIPVGEAEPAGALRLDLKGGAA